jgi:hypothetical protein
MISANRYAAPVNEETLINNGINFRNFRLLGRALGYSIGGVDAHLNYTVEDSFMGLRRLTIAVHGEPSGIRGVGRMMLNEDGLTAGQSYTWFTRQGYDLSAYDRIQLAMCYGADNGGSSFAARFATITGKPVHAYEGLLTVDHASIDLFIDDIDAFEGSDGFNTIENRMNAQLAQYQERDEAYWLGLRSNSGHTFFPHLLGGGLEFSSNC